MAASVLKDDYLRCVVCCEVFNDPTSLQCSHTFCRNCLVEFVQVTKGVVKSRGIPCPVCGQITPVPDPQQPVNEWVGQMQTNVHIAGLVDALDPEEKECSICKTDGKNTKATSWCDQCDSAFCDNCQNFHSKAPSSKSHNVIEISSMSLQSLEARRQRFCQDHKEKRLKYFCEDCDVLTCGTCLIIEHRKCDNVLTVSEAVKNRRSQLKKHQENLTLELEKAREKLSVIKEVKTDFCKRQKTIEMSIKDTADKIVADIREKEKDLLQELTEISEREIKIIEEDMKTIENITKVTLQNIQLITQLITSGSDYDVISQQKQLVSEKTSPGKVHDMSVRQIDLQFTSNLSDIQDMFSKQTLGELFVNKHLDLETSANTRMTEDNKEPDLKDIIVLITKGIKVTVVTDYRNKSVKCFYIKHDKTRNSRVDVGGSPWNVTKLTRDMIAVSMPYQNQICLISVTPDLRCHSTINTKTTYCGLTAINQNTLAVGSPDTHSVDLIDLTGRILTSVTTDMSGQELFYWPNYLCISPAGDVIVCDWNKEAVTCLTQKGNVLFRYQPGESQLDCPCGVSCDQSGDVFVVDHNLHKLTKITRRGQFVKDILTSQDGLKYPWSVCYHDNRLYVTQSAEIRVFRLN